MQHKRTKYLIIFIILILVINNTLSQNISNGNNQNLRDNSADSIANIHIANNRDNVVAQMNYCITTLTNIIHNKSMSVLQHETDQILNNLTMEHIIGLPEINDYRIELLDAVSKFSITEQEREILHRIQSIKRDNAKWTALSGALNPTLLLTGGTGANMAYQLAFQTLLTAARSVVEYQTIKGEQNIEELRAMWDLRKIDLNNINEIRKKALKLTYTLFEKYNLSENERLTEATANDFSLYISESDAAKRVRFLESHRATYQHLGDYYYHLGMAYLDINNYTLAKPNFDKYLEMSKKNPLLRYDEKRGCIALAILMQENDINSRLQEALIADVITNLPHNSAAILQCALIYLNKFNDKEKTLQLIRNGIEDPNASDRPLLYMAAAQLLPIAEKHPLIKAEICKLFEVGDNIPLDAYLTFIISEKTNVWDKINSLIKFEEVNISTLNGITRKKLQIVLPGNIIYNNDDVTIFLEEHKKDITKVTQLQTYYANGVYIQDIEKIDCFKANRDLKYLYFDVLEPEKYFVVKSNIDYNQIKKEEWHRQSEFALSDDDINDIIDFCQDNTPKDYLTRVNCRTNKNEYISSTEGEIEMNILPNLSINNIKIPKRAEGWYLRIILNNGVILSFKHLPNCDQLVPLLYECETGVYYNPNKLDYSQTAKWYENLGKNIKELF